MQLQSPTKIVNIYSTELLPYSEESNVCPTKLLEEPEATRVCVPREQIEISGGVQATLQTNTQGSVEYLTTLQTAKPLQTPNEVLSNQEELPIETSGGSFLTPPKTPTLPLERKLQTTPEKAGNIRILDKTLIDFLQNFSDNM